MDYNSVWIFLKVVQAGSFSTAARQLAIPKSTVSKRISSLEHELRVTLLHRTTRSLQLTNEGRAYYERCSHAFAELTEAESQTLATAPSPRGLLRVTAPNEMAASFLPALIDQFMNAYPEVDIDLWVTDEVMDLLTDQVDVGLRVGNLQDSSLIARRIGTTGFRLYASSAYIKARGIPKSPGELSNHRCLRLTTVFEEPFWNLSSGSKKVSVRIAGRFTANSIATLKAMALEGHGITLLPDFVCKDEVERGTLIPVLPRWATDSDPVHLVYPPQKYPSARLEAFLQFMGPRLRDFFKVPRTSS